LEVSLSSLNESFPYPPSAFLKEEPKPRRLGSVLLAGAVFGSVLVFAGVQVANSHPPATLAQSVVASEAQSMSAAELIQNVKAKNRTVYWLTAKQGDSYSASSSTGGVDQISYRLAGSDISNLNQFDVMIGTYQDYSTYDAQLHQLLGSNGRTLNLSKGITLTYNQASPVRAIVTFSDRPEIIEINYPASQAVPTLINDAQNLAPII
jgi:hypothetical protein